MRKGEEGGSRRLRILLIAYEFPPSPSPQSLRWAYLTNRLAALGHEVHVLAPDIGGSMVGLPDPGPDVQIHRTKPGPVRALLGWLARRRPAASDVDPANAETQGSPPLPGSIDVPPAAEPPRLNWKGRLLEHFQHVVSWFLFPDLRAEWKRPALRALPALLERIRPDVVVSSHEPATTLELGLEAKRLGYRWVADLGDPVLAAYTPARWRNRAKKLEEATLRQADQVLVTTLGTASRLQDRYSADTPVTVLEQGFDERVPGTGQHHVRVADAPVELLYSGSFYSFRDPSVFVNAALAVPGIRLNIASGNLPAWLLAEADAHPDRLRLLGRVPHRQLLDLQRSADVLVNLANRDSAQVPGKFYEYLGACRPILHVQSVDQDAAGVLLEVLRRGWSIPGTRGAIIEALTRLRSQHEAGRLCSDLDVSAAAVTHWSWSTAATRLEAALREAVSPKNASSI